MGYFDAMASGAFKKDAQGRDLFFLGGAFGTGRVLPSPEAADELRAKIVRFYKVLFFIIIPLSLIVDDLVGGLPVYVASTLLIGLGAWLYVRHLVHGLPFSDERLTQGESFRNSARNYSFKTLIVLSVLASLFIALGIFVLADGEPEDRWAGIVCILMFGACLGVFLRMIALKRRQA